MPGGERSSLAELGGAGSIVSRTISDFVENLGVIAKMTLVVFAPLEVLKNWAFYSMGANENVHFIVRVDMFLEAIVGSLVVPTLIYALIARRQTGEKPGLGESFPWGYRQWGRTFGNCWLAGMAMLGGGSYCSSFLESYSRFGSRSSTL